MMVSNDRSYFPTDVETEDDEMDDLDDEFVTIRMTTSDLAKACGIDRGKVNTLSVHTQYYDGAVRVALRVT